MNNENLERSILEILHKHSPCYPSVLTAMLVGYTVNQIMYCVWHLVDTRKIEVTDDRRFAIYGTTTKGN